MALRRRTDPGERTKPTQRQISRARQRCARAHGVVRGAHESRFYFEARATVVKVRANRRTALAKAHRTKALKKAQRQAVAHAMAAGRAKAARVRTLQQAKHLLLFATGDTGGEDDTFDTVDEEETLPLG